MDFDLRNQGRIDVGGGGVACPDGSGIGGQGLSVAPKTRRGNRTGWTTGACAAAAARAATVGLVLGKVPAIIRTLLPNGQEVDFAVADHCIDAAGVKAVVVKDAGDDPDITHGARLEVLVASLPGPPGTIHLRGGIGVGTVTRPGLGLPVGEGAINPIPRQNITANVRAAAEGLLDTRGLGVTVSVPGGEALARKTLNPRLGILGGISILGTTGVVYPYSTSAYKAAVVQSIQGAAAAGRTTLALTTGRRTERFAMAHFPDWPEHAFVQMGDFVGAALQAASRAGLAQVVLVAMGGKLAKMAQGVDNTHAHKNELDMNRVALLAQQAGADRSLSRVIAQGPTVRFAVEEMARAGMELNFYRTLAVAAREGVRGWLQPGRTKVAVLALDFDGRFMVGVGIDE
ncbi:MAG: cobalt-precorrin-5B (C(1))-methyltransferase [Magnetococcales bacterium]|nr:cobalt-precorrin-5B (C(1))-methyltransferase [Magnetococcales bacterium]